MAGKPASWEALPVCDRHEDKRMNTKEKGAILQTWTGGWRRGEAGGPRGGKRKERPEAAKRGRLSRDRQALHAVPRCDRSPQPPSLDRLF